jgi:signal transduction histidine kinase
VQLPGHRKRSVAFWIALGVLLVAVAVTLNVTWVVANWRTGVMLLVGAASFAVLIAGLVLNTIFLVREIRRNEQHDAFINAVTHELKTPVASIRLYLQTLQSRELDDDKRQEFYQTMLQDTARLQGTIEQVLTAGAAGSRRKPIRAPVDIPTMVRESIEVVSRRHDLADGALSFSCSVPEGESAIVDGDVEELRAAVSNLIDNSIRYSGENVKVLIQISKIGTERVAIQVKDEGIGIASAELKQVFKRFYRIPGTLRVKGTGLGLFIVRAVAKRHGGKAYVESEGSDRGSTFTIELPLALSK